MFVVLRHSFFVQLFPRKVFCRILEYRLVLLTHGVPNALHIDVVSPSLPARSGHFIKAILVDVPEGHEFVLMLSILFKVKEARAILFF